MTKKFKIILGISYLLILFAFLYLIFSEIEFNRLDEFPYYKELQVRLDHFVGNNLILNLLIFFGFAVIWVSLLGFGSPLLILSGILFGKWLGTLVSTISITCGALILYSLANLFFKDLIKQILVERFKIYIEIFNKNEFYYFFIFRLVGGFGIPFFLQNTLPIIFNMKKYNYFFGSLLGFIPSFYILNTIGSGINNFIQQSDNFSLINLISNKEIYLPILFFLIFLLISFIIKKKIFYDQKN